MKDFVFHTSVPEDDAKKLAGIRKAAARDWTKFLLLRAKELKKGRYCYDSGIIGIVMTAASSVLVC
jgi:hypothetical protein